MHRTNSRGGGWAIRLTVMLLPVLAGAAAATPASAQGQPDWTAGKAPVSIVTNGWVAVRDILPSVAERMGLGLQMAPDVTGEVNVHLVDVPVARALSGLLEPAGLGYEVADGVLIVHKQGMVTRWFNFNYPVTQRTGRGELEISASAEQSGGSSGGGDSGGSQNKSHVTSTATMSIWPEVMSSLEALVFAGESAKEAGESGGDKLAVNLADAAGRSLVVNPMAGLVQVTAEFDRVQRVEGLLERLGSALGRQVAIEVRIMEVSLDEGAETGVNWSTWTDTDVDADLHTYNASTNIGDQFFQFVVDSRHLTGALQAIATSGDIRTLSTPRITTLNNQKAVVRVVREDIYYEAQVAPAVISNGVATEPVISYTPRSFSVGVILDVTPQVGADGSITLNVHPTISDVVGVAVSPNADQAPILSIRELDTVGKVQAGQTLVIAGLVTNRVQLIRSGIPLLKDIPLLGYLFGRTNHKDSSVELIMLLTPVLLEDSQADAEADSARAVMEARM